MDGSALAKERAPASRPALHRSSSTGLAAVDVDVGHVTAIVDRAAVRQVRLIGVAGRTVSTVAVRAVAIAGATAGETTDADRIAVRRDAGHAQHAAGRSGPDAKN